MPGKEIKGRSPIANYRDGGRTGFKEGMGAAKRRQKQSKSSDPHKNTSPGHPSQPYPKPKDGKGRPKGGSRPGPTKEKSPASFKSKPWGSGPKPGTLEYFQLHTQKPTRKPHKDGKQVKKNGPVRPINLPWPDENDPVPPKRKRK